MLQMKSYSKILLLLLVTLYVSCQKDVTVKVPDIPNGLTLFCRVEVGEQFRAVVGNSIGIQQYNRNHKPFVSDADVTLYRDGELLGKMTFDADLQEYLSGAIAEPGRRYKIKVEAPGYDAIEADAIAPSNIPLRIVNIRDTTTPAPYGAGGIVPGKAITLTFTDPAVANYYKLNFFSTYDVSGMSGRLGGYSGECLQIKDPSIEQRFTFIDGEDCIYGDILFNDGLFNASSKSITVIVTQYAIDPLVNEQGDSVYAVFRLTHISEAEYRYQKSYEQSQEADGNPFAEPVNVYTNIKNGYGIFSISTPFIVQVRQ